MGFLDTLGASSATPTTGGGFLDRLGTGATAPPAPANPYNNVPVLGQASNIGIGIGSALGKAALGVPEAFFRASSGVAHTIGADPSLSDKVANTIHDVSDRIYTKPFEGDLQTTSGQAGTVIGNVAPYFMGTGELKAAENLPGVLGKLLPKVIPQVAKDTAVSYAQSGGEPSTAAGTGLVSTAANVTSSLLPPGGKLLAHTVKNVLPGYVSDVSAGLSGQRGEDRTDVNALIPGAGTALSTLTGGAIGARNLIANAPEGASATLMNKVARINPTDARDFSTMSGGKTPGQFLDERGIYGNAQKVTAHLFDRFTQSKTAVDDALSKLPGLYKNQAVETALADVVDQAEKTSAPGVMSPYLTQAQTLLGKAQSGGLDMSEINAAKRLYESTVKMNYIKDGVSAGIERANNIDSTIRTWQQDMADKLGFTNIKNLNKETQLSKMLIDALGKKSNAQIGNNLVGLTDWIVASGIPHDPTALALLLGKKVFGSATGQGVLAKVLSNGKKLPAPSAAIGAMNTNPDTLQLPRPGGTSAASNLPPVIHAKTNQLGTEELSDPTIIAAHNARNALDVSQPRLNAKGQNPIRLPKRR